MSIEAVGNKLNTLRTQYESFIERRQTNMNGQNYSQIASVLALTSCLFSCRALLTALELPFARILLTAESRFFFSIEAWKEKSGSCEKGQWRWPRGQMLTYRHCGPGIDSRCSNSLKKLWYASSLTPGFFPLEHKSFTFSFPPSRTKASNQRKLLF